MLKFITVILVLVAYCYCADNEVLMEDSRASKKKKSSFRLWAMVLFFVFSKMAVFKVASFMFFFMMFQKLFYLAGLFLNFFMRQKMEKGGPPPAVYGPPAEYNTIGYSYGPPEAQHTEPAYPGTEYGLPPALTEIGGSINNWLFNKNP